MKSIAVFLVVCAVAAQQTLYGQCGGNGWSGTTTCFAGSCCTVGNPYYSQCLPGECGGPISSGSSITTLISTSSKATSVSTKISTAVVPPSVTAVAPSGNFTNPILYEDFADNDIFRVGDTYYFSASNMHFSPGAPILRSYDLTNWEIIGHSVPSLNFGANYNLTGDQVAYREGTWASTLRYRKSNGLWYWIGCIDFWNTYIFTASSVTGPWKQAASMPGTCYYDCGLLIDDDDSMYVVYGGTNVSVAKLSADGLSQVKSQPVFNAGDVPRNGIEGNRMYKRNGLYYVLDDDSQGTTIIWKASNPFGPYTHKVIIDNVNSPVPNGGTLDQGSLVETQNGDWYFMSFAWAYPSGRLPVLAPVTWGSDGFPSLVTDPAGAWGKSYPNPLPPRPLANWTGTDTFRGTSLAPAWEWNHNPDETKYSVNNGLTLHTATVTKDLYHARNTLVHRLHGEFPVGTVAIDFTNMADGDIAGLSAFRDTASWIGVLRTGSSYSIQVRANATQDLSTWATVSTGTVTATAPLSITGKKIWFRVAMDARASGTKLAQYSYSLDGAAFTPLGPKAALSSGWELFLGYRFGIFNFATKALGGSILVTAFTSA